MNSTIKHYYTIHNNLFIFSPIILEFYKNNKTTDMNILLAYLILPLVLDDKTKNKLYKSKKTTTLFSFTKENSVLWGLQPNVEKYFDLTNKCIQYLVNENLIDIKNNSIFVTSKNINLSILNIEKEKKASEKLAAIFNKFDILTIYKTLGIKKLCMGKLSI